MVVAFQLVPAWSATATPSPRGRPLGGHAHGLSSSSVTTIMYAFYFNVHLSKKKDNNKLPFFQQTIAIIQAFSHNLR